MKKHTLLQRLLPLAMLAAMLARAAGLAANEERADAFADAASIPAWARGSVGGGTVSLKNVTVRGSVIVKGGGQGPVGYADGG